MKALFGVFFLIMVSFVSGRETVYCIHGFMRDAKSMNKIEKAFVDLGYNVRNWGYPSRDKIIEDHMKDLLIDLQKTAQENPGDQIHFVTHSLGGIIARGVHNLQGCPDEVKMGRAILLSPPNQGSRFAHFLAKFKFMRKLVGRNAGHQLIYYKNFDYLGQFPKEKRVLVISGTCGWNFIIGEKNDGKVGVSETRLATPHEHKTRFLGHSWMMYSSRAIRDATEFIKT